MEAAPLALGASGTQLHPHVIAPGPPQGGPGQAPGGEASYTHTHTLTIHTHIHTHGGHAHGLWHQTAHAIPEFSLGP